MTPKLLKTEEEYEAALAHIDNLMDAESGSPEEQELELWSVLIEKFEEEYFPIARPDPISAIEFRMEQMGLDRSDSQRFIPSKSKISEVLSRRRPLSLQMIRALHSGLGIPADILVQDTRVQARQPGSAQRMRKKRKRTASKKAVGAW